MSRPPLAGAEPRDVATVDPSPRPAAVELLREPQSADFVLGDGKVLRASVRVSPVGVLAIAVLVSGILLSTRALVGTAIRESRRPRG